MKKTILVMLMAVMLATPCMAEVEPEGIFSIGGTQWQSTPIFPPTDVVYNRSIGFYRGGVYESNTRRPLSFYIDLGILSFFFDLQFAYGYQLTIGIMQPIGIGVMTVAGAVGFRSGIMPLFQISTLLKVNDNWEPSKTITYISPARGAQGTTLTDVGIWSKNTFFQENPPVEISFDPPDGLTVSSIEVISNTEIEFDVEIAVDAPVGYRTVIVTYDDGKQSIDSDDLNYGNDFWVG